jgi:hypothetical protein
MAIARFDALAQRAKIPEIAAIGLPAPQHLHSVAVVCIALFASRSARAAVLASRAHERDRVAANDDVL